MTVIIPSYDCRKYLIHAIRRVQIQAVDSLEIIVIDDTSTDGSWILLEGMSVIDLRIRLYRLKGLGGGKGKELCDKKTRVWYLAFLDADDNWLPAKLQQQLTFHLENPRVALSFTNYVYVDPQGGAIWAIALITGLGFMQDIALTGRLLMSTWLTMRQRRLLPRTLSAHQR